ncbi:hypothetical protein [Listeria kieliensis]|uniref:Uncharacterized protein n=1 Tax=Listeria kieliensis TaxID=1621700 RepID=A0A3D8TLD5_9LIST|nr:hypothetical protein [Listeria kieliensis]RDW99433.1 hypothetical protein UR08_11400 [Listeria kieliensis]
MARVIRFLEEHSDELINYWFSTYYVKSEEYQERKCIPGYLDAQYSEAKRLFVQSLKKCSTKDVTESVRNIGEDRRDMNIDIEDMLKSHFDFYTALMEFITIHHDKKNLDCSVKELFSALLELRKIETSSALELYKGYTIEPSSTRF